MISAWPRSSAEPVLAIGFSAAVLAAYEQVGEAFGLDVGSVETSTMALLRGLERGPRRRAMSCWSGTTRDG